MNKQSTKTNVDLNPKIPLKAKLIRFGSSMMMPIATVAFAMIISGIASTFSHIDSVKWLYDILINTSNAILGIFPLLVALSIANTYAKQDKGMVVITTFILYILFSIFQTAFISLDPSDGLYDVWFYKNIDPALFTVTLGMLVLSTSVFGGILIGFIGVFLYSKTFNIKLPKPLMFFSGSRLPPILTFFVAPLLGSLILITWPALGWGIIKMGEGLMYLPAGLDAFFYGFFNRLLLPFGLHTLMLSVFAFSSATGVLTQNGIVIATGDYMIWHVAYQNGIPFDLIQAGGTFIWNGDTYTITNNVNPGQFTQGWYPIMIFAFPAAGLAMTLKSTKDNKWMAIFVVSLIPMFCGVTETFEYLFIFTHPILYLFHAFMSGISFMLMDAFGVSMGMSSGWIVDVALFGIIPQVQGNYTNVHIMPIIGSIMFVSYFVFFYIFYKDVDTVEGNMITPLGEAKEIVKIENKKEVKSEQDKKYKRLIFAKKQTKEYDHDGIVKALGGFSNLKTIDACITRLRLNVKDSNKVKDKQLKQLGALAVVKQKNNVQVIFGQDSDSIKNNIIKLQSINKSK